MDERENWKLRAELCDSIIEDAPIAIFVTDPSGRFVTVNRAAEQQTGLSRERLLCKSFQQLLHPPSASAAEYRTRRANGDSYWMRVREAALSDGQHRVAFTEDVTERRAREQELHLLKTAIALAPEPILIADIDARIQYVNPAFERASGYSAEEVLGQNPRMLASGNQSPEFYRELWAQLLSGRVWEGRFTNRRKDGSLYVEDTAISPVRDAEGELVSYVAVKRDVTKTLKLEEELRQAKKMEALGRLASGVAHDFNNLLTIILSSTAMALDALPPGADRLKDDLESSMLAARRAEALTQQLLAFSRRQVLSPEIISLNDTVDGMLDMIQRLIGERITVSMALEADLWSCKVDPGQIEQVLLNLAVNARDAMPDGGELSFSTSNVSLHGEPESFGGASGDHVRLRIRDAGCGMDEQTRLHAFDPFFTTKAAGKGTGLGLSTVHGAVRQCGGYIQLQSEVGQGCMFDIYFPRAVDRKSDKPKLASARPRRPLGQETVLVVEDEDAVRAVAVRVLERAGHRVLSTASGHDALRIAEAEPAIDLLLSDLVMPGLSGIDVAEGVRALHPGAAVLFMSGYPDEAIDRFRSTHACASLLQKPFGPELLLASIDHLLEGDEPISSGGARAAGQLR